MVPCGIAVEDVHYVFFFNKFHDSFLWTYSTHHLSVMWLDFSLAISYFKLKFKAHNAHKVHILSNWLNLSNK